MYKNFYLQASQAADMIQSGEYKKYRQARSAETENLRQGLVNRREQAEEDKTSFDPVEMVSNYMSAIRSDATQLKADTEDYLSEENIQAISTADFVPANVGATLVQDLEEILGITREQAAGIVGSFDYETGSFKFMQEIDPLVEGSRGGFGFAQWTGPRRVAFEKWSEENNLDPSSYEANLGFFIHEVQNTNEGRFYEDLMDAKTAGEAARIFTNQYLRPSKQHANMEERMRRAETYVGGGEE